MLSGSNTPQPAMLPWLSAAVLLLAAPALLAQDSASVPEFEASHARQAYEVARNWVRQGRVPDSPLSIEVRRLAAAHVTLRRQGPTLGQATVSAGDPLQFQTGSGDDGQPRVVNAMSLLRRAMKKALADVAGTLDPSQQLSDVAPDLLLDVQFAYPPEDLNIERLSQLPARMTIDVHGLAMRRGDRWAWRFPGNSIAANTSLRGQLNRLLAKLELPLTQMARIGQSDGPKLYRFRAIHLVQPTHDQPVLQLHRGNKIIASGSFGDRRLDELARQQTQYLIDHQRNDGRFTGTYEPTADRYRPATANSYEAAQAALALARVARFSGADEDRRQRAAEAARAALKAIDRSTDAERQQSRERVAGEHLAPTAMALMAVLETPRASELRDLRVRLTTRLKTMQKMPGGRFRRQVASQAEDAPIGMQAMASAALTQLYDHSRDDETLRRCRAALDTTWKLLEDKRFADGLPWLCYAELTLNRLGHGRKAVVDLVQKCKKLWEKQVTPWSETTPTPSPDTIGGFRLKDGLIREPTWQSSHLLTTQARILQEPDLLTPNRRTRWLSRCGLAARFLAQLRMRPSNCYYTRNPQAAIGGTRLSFWDNRQPINATAASLLAVTELQRALQRLSESAGAAEANEASTSESEN